MIEDLGGPSLRFVHEKTETVLLYCFKHSNTVCPTYTITTVYMWVCDNALKCVQSQKNIFDSTLAYMSLLQQLYQSKIDADAEIRITLKEGNNL